jgi:Xaa-Pro aminopeptidase
MFHDLSIKESLDFQQRRANLVARIKEQYPEQSGVVIFFAGFEQERIAFRQESSFYYLSGLTEPGLAMTINLDGATQVYMPHYAGNRAQWVSMPPELSDASTRSMLGFDELHVLGEVCQGYQFSPLFTQSQYAVLLEAIKNTVQRGGAVFTLYPKTGSHYIEQRLLLERLCGWIPQLAASIVDISPLVAQMRRCKSSQEIARLYEAVDITIESHEWAARYIAQDYSEKEIQAVAEYAMIGSGATPAFPSIVATGLNATILHYTPSKNEVLKNGDLVVVDIGAELDYYCGDLTRTYPVSRTFDNKQRELYTIVLEAQEYIESIAAPGMWLSNSKYPDQSLNHLARKFFAKHGFEEYFVHSIGHYLGLDVHDVGSYEEPLMEGDVITIEPGLYMPHKRTGIRIEDNYWIVKGGAVCLSEKLPKSIEEVEEFMASSGASGCDSENDACGMEHDETEH